MTGADLWNIFNEECKKEHILALTFGPGITGRVNKSYDDGPPLDLTVWNRIAARLERDTIEVVVESLKQQKGLRHA
jgi:hypothetical protein